MMGKRDEQKKARRMEILIAALDLFITKGYSATKISDIAERVDMSMGLMFHYFDSKEALYEELIRAGLSGPAMVMQQNATKPLAFFRGAAEMILEGIRSSSYTAKMFVLMNQAFFDSGAPESARAMLSKLDIVEVTVPLIEAGQKEGIFRAGDPYALSIMFWGAINGVSQYAAMIPDAPIPETEWMLDLLRRK